jgi:hypothetical protein
MMQTATCKVSVSGLSINGLPPITAGLPRSGRTANRVHAPALSTEDKNAVLGPRRAAKGRFQRDFFEQAAR